MPAPTVEIPVNSGVATTSGTNAEIDSALSENYTNIENHKADTGNPHGVTASQVGLGNVDNTSDVDKPISSAAAASVEARGPRPTQGQRAGGVVPFHRDPFGSVVDYLKSTTGVRSILGLKLPGWRPQARGATIPIISDAEGNGVLSHDMRGDRILVARPVQGISPAANGKRVVISGDTYGVKQLFVVKEDSDGGTEWSRQLTYCQDDVVSFDIQLPQDEDDDEVVQFTRSDQPFVKGRHVVGRARIPDGPPVAEEPTEAVFVMVIGQSNSGGAGSEGGSSTGAQTVNAPMVTRDESFDGRLLMFNGGTMPHQSGYDVADIAVPINSAQITSLVPMREGAGAQNRESYVTSLCLQLNGPGGFDGGRYIIGGAFGFGSSSFTDLVLDGPTVQQPYQNALDAITSAKSLCDAQSVSMSVVVVYDQGEADANTPEATFRDYMTSFQSDLETRIGAITGQLSVDLFVAQTVWTRGSLNEPCLSSYGQQLAAVADANIHLLPPAYFTDPEGDDIHHRAPEHQWRGALYGECMASVMVNAVDLSLTMVSASWTGDTMDVTFSRPVRFDQNTVIDLDATKLGMSHNNSNGSTRTITGVSKIGPSSIRLQMISPIPIDAVETVFVAADTAVGAGGGGTFGYATGLRSAIRADDSTLWSMIDGRPLPIFAAIQSLSATGA